MNKNEILKGLTEAHQGLDSANKVLKSITLSEIWDKDSQVERDGIVLISQAIEKHINEIIEIEKQILSKK